MPVKPPHPAGDSETTYMTDEFILRLKVIFVPGDGTGMQIRRPLLSLMTYAGSINFAASH